jgi:hypothetical protein
MNGAALPSGTALLRLRQDGSGRSALLLQVAPDAVGISRRVNAQQDVVRLHACKSGSVLQQTQLFK